MKNKLIAELNKIIIMLVNNEYENLTKTIDCQDLTSTDISNIIKDFGQTLIIPSSNDLEQLNIIEVEENKWAIDFDLWTKESGKSDLTIQLTIIKSSDNNLRIELDDIRVL